MRFTLFLALLVASAVAAPPPPLATWNAQARNLWLTLGGVDATKPAASAALTRGLANALAVPAFVVTVADAESVDGSTRANVFFEGYDAEAATQLQKQASLLVKHSPDELLSKWAELGLYVSGVTQSEAR